MQTSRIKTIVFESSAKTFENSALDPGLQVKTSISGDSRQKEKAALKRPKFREETNPQGGDSEKKTRITQ